MKLVRVGTEPLLKPRAAVPWEKDAVFNAAAAHDGKLFHLLYRGVAHNPGARNESCIGHAWSEDGIHFERSEEPVLRNKLCPEETCGVEDPRLAKIDGVYHLSYVSWNKRQIQISRATSTDLKSWSRQGVMFGHELFGNNKNASLFPERIGGRYALIHRPMGFDGELWPLDVWLSYSDDLKSWSGHRRMLRARREECAWEYAKIGLGAQPIKTPSGWLLIYHAVDRSMTYRLGAALLDLERPEKVLKRTDFPILEPEAPWELKGDVPNVVFTCGAVLLGSELWVYYGGADTVIGLAKCDVSDFLRV